jgi:ArsR family transcriptional regulator
LTSPHVAQLLAVARLILTGVLSGQVELLEDLRMPAASAAVHVAPDPGGRGRGAAAPGVPPH